MSEARTLTVEEAMFEPRADLDRLQKNAFAVGIVAALALAAGFFTAERADFFRAYLIGWLFCLGLAMGLTAINMLNHVSGGYWGVSLRRVLEASGRTLPYFVILFLPIAFFGIGEIYHWAEPGITDPASANYDALIAYKAEYLLTEGYFIGYSLAILVIWTVLAFAVSVFSKRYEESGLESHRVNMQRVSAAGLIIYVLTGTIASVLWIMSLDPHWFSSLFGFIFVAGHALSAFAFAVPTLVFLTARKPFAHLSPKIMTKLFHDYGKLMLAFVALWAYFMMSQFLIIWSGNLPEEVTWYLDRSTHGWQLISIVLVVVQFVLPFLLLLSQNLKKQPNRLIWVAFWLLAVRWFDIYWQVAPSVAHDHVAFAWFEPLAPLAIGGIWLGLLVGQLKNRAVMPVREPALKEVLAHG